MDRRQFLSAIGVAGLSLSSGCLSMFLTPSAAVDFELWNNSSDSHTVDVTIQDARDKTVLTQSFEIGPQGTGSVPGGPVIREQGFTDATPDEQFDAVAVLDEEVRDEHRFQATCVEGDTPDVFIIEIKSGKEANLSFKQSVCS